MTVYIVLEYDCSDKFFGSVRVVGVYHSFAVANFYSLSPNDGCVRVIVTSMVQ